MEKRALVNDFGRAVPSAEKILLQVTYIMLSFRIYPEKVYQATLSSNTFRIKSSVLMIVSLSRIARDNLMNNDDTTIYNNDKNDDIS